MSKVHLNRGAGSHAGRHEHWFCKKKACRVSGSPFKSPNIVKVFKRRSLSRFVWNQCLFSYNHMKMLQIGTSRCPLPPKGRLQLTSASLSLSVIGLDTSLRVTASSPRCRFYRIAPTLRLNFSLPLLSNICEDQLLLRLNARTCFSLIWLLIIHQLVTLILTSRIKSIKMLKQEGVRHTHRVIWDLLDVLLHGISVKTASALPLCTHSYVH